MFGTFKLPSELSDKLSMTGGTKTCTHNATHKLALNSSPDTNTFMQYAAFHTIHIHACFRERWKHIWSTVQLFRWAFWKGGNCQSWGIFPTGFDTQVRHWHWMKGLIHWSVLHSTAGGEWRGGGVEEEKKRGGTRTSQVWVRLRMTTKNLSMI